MDRLAPYDRLMDELQPDGPVGLVPPGRRIEKPSASLFVALVLRYVGEGRRDLAASAIRAGVGPDERAELVARLAGIEGAAAQAARAALAREAVLPAVRLSPAAGAPCR